MGANLLSEHNEVAGRIRNLCKALFHLLPLPQYLLEGDADVLRLDA